MVGTRVWLSVHAEVVNFTAIASDSDRCALTSFGRYAVRRVSVVLTHGVRVSWRWGQLRFQPLALHDLGVIEFAGS